MPWRIEKRGSKHVVVNTENGDVRGRHDSRAAAVAQLRALYANVPEARRAARRMVKHRK